MSPADENDRIAFAPLSRRRRKRTGLSMIVVFMILLIAGGAAAWFAVDRWWPADENGEIPLVRAPSGPVKVKPDDPGGMAVPNQDKLVYDRMGTTGSVPEAERLLPPPETPLPAPKSAPIPAPSAIPEPPAAVAAPQTTQPPPPQLPTSTATPQEVEAVQPPPPAPPPPAPEVAAKPAAPRTGSYKVQLVAVRSPEAANKEWERLRQRNSDLLAGMELSVTKADLGPDKGIYYRLRAGPLADEEAAKKLCAELTKRKIGCLVVRPGG